VANVSHELKTPITSIKGYVETLQEGALSDEENAGRFLEIISKHTDRLGEIIDDLLELSRIEEISKDDEQFTRPTSVNALFDKVIQDHHIVVKQKNMQVIKEVDAEIQININEKLMIHALGNLLDNALKYSSPGAEVKLRCSTDKKKTIIEVIDFGLGISKEHTERIFERFYRVDKGRSRDVGGTGLGLSIVKHIGRLHDAKLEVESTPGEGSTFRLIFQNSD